MCNKVDAGEGEGDGDGDVARESDAVKVDEKWTDVRLGLTIAERREQIALLLSRVREETTSVVDSKRRVSAIWDVYNKAFSKKFLEKVFFFGKYLI